ncbi:uncharacterized protein LOC132193991 isoform X3 [Neocloeon triangulifer]|uniref:uncharacterized protein LOC132193991 isoform X3 n=1 Tax=Neocloeon triangulifer TaxID=2078957 RepID=UPI00286F3920|nr:uncharacterized protein LOC132193991 isoform X3 [Neocloeon triangulifer]
MNSSKVQAGSSSLSEKELACLGYFENNQNADDACVLVVSYEFKDDAEMRRYGNEKDLENLRKSFKEKRKCRYKELTSPTAEDFLTILANEEELLKLFNISTVPSAFFLIILSHGAENNIILTDHKNECGYHEFFLTSLVVEAIKRSPNLRVQLNVIFFGPCRGFLTDMAHREMKKHEDYRNQTSSRLTNMPGAENFVIVYSTVETTFHIRDTSKGTWLVQGICTLLDDLEKDEPLEVFLTKLQHWIHGKLIGVGQTPEVKYTRHRKFVIFKATKPEVVGETQSGGKGGKGTYLENSITAKRSAFFQWRTKHGMYLREKWAEIFTARVSDPNVKCVEKALRKNLGFTTNILENSKTNLKSLIQKTQGEQGEVGCFLAVFFAPLFLNEENEVCVLIGNTFVKIGDLVYKFLGPGNKMWIGRPKLFFFVDQTIDFDNFTTVPTSLTLEAKRHSGGSGNVPTSLTPEAKRHSGGSGNEKYVQKLELDGTNHSGYFICILKDSDRLIQVFENPDLKNDANILELTLDLVRNKRDLLDTVLPQVSSTLHCLLNFENKPACFVEPTFKTSVSKRTINSAGMTRLGVMGSKIDEENEKQLTFQQLLEKLGLHLIENQNEEDYTVCIISSLPGSGKSTVVKELACHLSRNQNKRKIVSIQLKEKFEYLSSTNKPTINEFLKYALGFGINDKLVLLLDGFNEICPMLRDKLLDMLLNAVQCKIPLLITTQYQEEGIIMETLENVSKFKVEIEPLSETDQLGLLEMKALLNYEDCTEFFQKMKNLGVSDVLKNPLHLILTTEMWMENRNSFSTSYRTCNNIIQCIIEYNIKKNLGINKRINVIRFSKAFVEVEDLLQDLAIQKVLSDRNRKWSVQDMEAINNSGLASISENNSRFVNDVYAQLLITNKYVKDINERNESGIQILKKKNLRQCRKFYDSFLSTVYSDDSTHYIKLNNYLRSDSIKEILNIVVKEDLKNIHQFIEPSIEKLAKNSTFVAPRFTSLLSNISKKDTKNQILNELRESSSSMSQNRSNLLETHEPNEKNLTFDELKQEMKLQLLDSGEQDYCVWLFSSLPGSGKSTVLLEIANYLNKEPTDKTIFNIQLQQYYEYFYSERSPNIVNLLSKSTEMSHNDAKKLVQERKSVVFLDGFDEICPDLRVKVMNIIKDVTKMKMPLVIATRPEEEETLLKSLDWLSTRKIVIKPLEREEQLELLLNLGKKDCEKLFNLFETSGATDILKNPFHLSLISGVNLQSDQGIFCIYEKVIKKKVTEALQTSKESRTPKDFVVDERIQLLQEISLRFLLNDGSIPPPTDVNLINNTGVASMEEGKIRFVHQTFAEFLVAQRFIQEIEFESASSIPIFQNANLRQCRVFINSYISQNTTFSDNLSIFFDQSQNVDIHSILREQLDHILQELKPNLKNLLNSGDINKRDTNGNTLLTLAAQFSSEEICRLLVENGADLSAVDEDGNDALHCACIGGKLENIKYLLGLNGFSVEKKSRYGKTALHMAAENDHVAMAEFLLSKGANVNVRDDYTSTPFILAAQFSCEEMCRLLVENGADLSAVDKYGHDALHLACLGGKLHIAKYLLGLNDFSVEMKGRDEKTALHMAAYKGHVAVAEFLLSKGAKVNARDENNKTPLASAAQFSSEEMCRFLVGKDADLSAVDNYGDDALHLACQGGKLHNAKYLLGLNGFSVEKKGHLGRTALHCAAFNGHVAVAEFLLSKGANVNARDNKNYTPFILAAQFSYEEMCQLLVENGADLSAVANTETTLCIWPASEGNWTIPSICWD